MMPENSVEMGLLARPMKEQHPILDDEVAAHFDRDNEAISRLRVRGLLTCGEADRARARYVKSVEQWLKAKLNTQPKEG